MIGLQSVAISAVFMFAVAGCAEPSPSVSASTNPVTTGGVQANPAPMGLETALQQAHSGLGITPSQEPQWDAFAQHLRSSARHMRDMATGRIPTGSAMNAMDEMNLIDPMLMASRSEVQKAMPAMQQLYDALSPQQRSKFGKLVISHQIGSCGLICRAGIASPVIADYYSGIGQ